MAHSLQLVERGFREVWCEHRERSIMELLAADCGMQGLAGDDVRRASCMG